MAYVDGSKSYMEGSDEIPLHICGPCKDDGETITANHYCEHCKDYLCDACKDYHRKFKATKTHKILSGSLLPKLKSPADIFTCNVICSCNQNKEVEIYCEDHTEVLCTSCEMIKHRKCKTSSLQDTRLSYRKENFDLTLEKANTLENKIENTQKKRSEDLKKLDTLNENCLAEIRKFRSQINDLLDKAEETVLVDLKENTEEQRNCLMRDISTLTNTLQALNSETKLLENANKNGKKEIMFAADNKASMSIQEYESLIQEMEKEMQTPDLLFEMNTTLIDLLMEIKSLGTITGSKMRTSQQSKKALLDLKVIAKHQVNIRIPDDAHTPRITGCAFIGQYILLCDNENKKLKLLDNSWKIKDSLILHSSPWNTAVVDAQRAIITLPNDAKLQYIHVLPQLKAGNTIALNYRAAGVQVIDNEIYTVCRNGKGEDEILILDLTGNSKRKISLETMTYMPNYISLGFVESNTHMYVSDWEDSTVTCLRSDGTVVYEYKDQELVRANGIYVDPMGNALVCGSSSDNVIILTANGIKHRSLLASADGIELPICIAFRPEDSTLIVGSQHGNNLFVFTLDNKLP